MLPRVKINFKNGALLSTTPSADGVVGVIGNGSTGKTYPVDQAFVVFSTDGYKKAMGTNYSDANIQELNSWVADFYKQAGEGAELWIWIASSTGLSIKHQLVFPFQKSAKGRLNSIFVIEILPVGAIPQIADGLNSDLSSANLALYQAEAERCATELMSPVFIVIEGHAFTGDAVSLMDLTTLTLNRVGIFLGKKSTSRTNQRTGLLAGRIASTQVQRHAGRVKDGAITLDSMMLGNTEISQYDSLSLLNDKGYITLRNFVGKAGYFVTDDPLATAIDDDYRFITRRRTIDKAYRIAYATMINELNDEVPINNDGTINYHFIKSWQTLIENKIAQQMTANGELSVDDTDNTDRGVKAYIDTKQDVVSNGVINMDVQVRPFGYSKYLNIGLGFIPVTN